MKIYKIANFELVNVPSVLYHATFKRLLPSIRKNGLGNYQHIRHINFENDSRGVFMHRNPEEAKDYVEASENDNIPDDWFDEIIVIPINTSSLDLSRLIPDPELESNKLKINSPFKNDADSYDSFLYKGIISL